MSYLTCSLDGLRYCRVNEGFGSLFEHLISSFALSQRLNIPYSHSNMVNIGHYTHDNISSKEWDEKWNQFILDNLIYQNVDKENKTVTDLNNLQEIDLFKNSNVIMDMGNILSKLYLSDMSLILDILGKLREYYHRIENVYPCYFNKEFKNVAIHIRKFTSTDCDDNVCRDLYRPGNYMEDFFINVIKLIKDKYQPNNCYFHIYSQGNLVEFNAFSKLKEEGILIDFHINEDTMTTLHHLIKADILIMSKSSFSYIASIYSKGEKFIRQNTPYNVLPEIKSLSSDGTSILS